MSRTYRYPRESLEDSIVRDEFDADLRIREKIDKQKHRKKRLKKAARSFIKMISFRDRQRARM